MTSDARAMSRNLSLITFNKVIQLIGGALWALLIPRWLGPETYGQLALAIALSMFLWWLGDLGGLEVFGRYIPILETQKPDEARKLFGQMFWIRCLIAASLLPALLILAPWLAPLLNAPWLPGWPAALIAAAAGIHIISWTSYHLLYARKEMGKWSVELSWRLIVQLPLILLVGKWGITAQLTAYTANEIIYLALALWWTRDWFRSAALRPDLAFVRPYLRMGSGFWATNFGLIVLFRTGTILVAIFTGDDAQISYYDLALIVFFLVFTIIDQLARAFLPTVSQFHEGGQRERAGSWLQIVTQWGAALGVLAVVAVQYTAHWIMPIVLGSAYGQSALVLQVMLLALPALVLVSVGTVATAMHANARAKLIAIAIGILAFYGSSPYFTHAWGAVGAAWSLTLGLSTYALILFAFIRHDLRVRWLALIGIFGLGLPLLLLRPLVADNFLLALVASLIASLLYLGAAFALRLLSPAPLQLASRLILRRRPFANSR